jgi:chromosome partitioning protein
MESLIILRHCDAPQLEQMESFLIANPKGGVGKSTLATNLAGWFAKSGKRVMLGDLDRQQSSRQWLMIRSPALPVISTWNVREGNHLSPPKDATHVVLDSPAGLHGKKFVQALKQVSRVIVPVSPSLFDIFATRQFLDELLAAKRARNEAVRIALVGMRVDAHTRAAGELERFFEATGLPVIAHLRDTQNYVQAAAHGMTIFDMPGTQCQQDLEHWAPLLRWADPMGGV